MKWCLLILLIIGQSAAGYGLLRWMRVRLRLSMQLALAQLLGIAVFSLVPFLLQLASIPLTALSISIALIVAVILCNLPVRPSWKIQREWKLLIPKIRLYEWPILLVTGAIIVIAAWRCFYLPPTPRDLTSGAEVIAHYAVKEGSLVNSVFTVNLETTNNQFKPPFITSLQLIYKFAGFPFGQVWLSLMTFSFLLFVYKALTRHIHRLIAGFLLLLLVAIPEMYAYSFMALFDYPNALYFTIACWFLVYAFEEGNRRYFLVSGIFLGLATYIRSETLVLSLMLSGVLFFDWARRRRSMRNLFRATLAMTLPSILLYILPVTVYINYYLPVDYKVEGLVNSDLFNPLPLFERFRDMNLELLFHEFGVKLYGYIAFIFLIVAIIDRVFSDNRSRLSKNWGYAILVVYFGLPLLGFLLPLMDLFNSTKRSLFKLFPLLILYMGHSQWVQDLSLRLSRWEMGERASAEEASAP